MRKILKGLVIALAVLAVACVAIVAYANVSGTSSSNPIDTLTNTVANTALDASGLKDKIDSTLRENSASIASATGLSSSQVDDAIDSLDVQNWTIATLPDNASESSSYSGTYDGTDATITTYDDPSYVTVSAYGQNVTFAIPESAQSSLSFISS